MLHLFKKHIARLQQPLINNVPNGEFSDLCQRLHSIKLTLKYTLSMLQSTNRTWILQIQQQRQFSERFHEAYPSTADDTYVVAKHFAEESQSLYDHFTRDIYEPGKAPTYENIQKQVRLYVTEIETVESSYATLKAAKSEAARYQSKLDAMERSKRSVDTSKRQRNQQKLDAVRNEYHRHLKEIVTAQKKTFSKYPVVFKAALTSYWLSHEKHVNALVESLEQTQTFAKAYEQEMSSLDITNITAEEIERLAAVDIDLLHNLEQAESLLQIKKRASSNSVDDIGVRYGQASKPPSVPVDVSSSAYDERKDDSAFNNDRNVSIQEPQSQSHLEPQPQPQLEQVQQQKFPNPSPASINGMGSSTAWSPVSTADNASPSAGNQISKQKSVETPMAPPNSSTSAL